MTEEKGGSLAQRLGSPQGLFAGGSPHLNNASNIRKFKGIGRRRSRNRMLDEDQVEEAWTDS